MRNNNNNINDTSIVFIPNYIVAALKANGITLSDLESLAMNNVEISSTLGKLSKYDLLDLYVANDRLFKDIIGVPNDNGQVTNYINYELYSYVLDSHDLNSNKAYTDIIRNLSTGTSILMSDNNNEQFTFETGEHTLFVILHTGFSDLRVGNDNEKREAFTRELLDKVYKAYGEQAGNINIITRAFIGSTMVNSIRKYR